MAEVSDLRRDPCLLRQLLHVLRLGDIERHRLLHVHVDAALHRPHRREGVVVVRRADEDRVDGVSHLVEHLTVVGEVHRTRNGFAASGNLRDLFAQLCNAGGVGIDHRDDLLGQHELDDFAHAMTTPDQRHTDFRALRDLPPPPLSETGAADVEQRDAHGCHLNELASSHRPLPSIETRNFEPGLLNF